MPNPIPDWDLARRLVKYVGMKQIAGELVTVRETTVTMGIGWSRLEDILKEKNIIYKVIEQEKDSSGKDLILIEYVPHNLALDAGISNRELDVSYRKFLDKKQHGEIRLPPRRTRITKKKREQMKVQEFWSGGENERS